MKNFLGHPSVAILTLASERRRHFGIFRSTTPGFYNPNGNEKRIARGTAERQIIIWDDQTRFSCHSVQMFTFNVSLIIFLNVLSSLVFFTDPFLDKMLCTAFPNYSLLGQQL